ncbi:MAG TPA: histidine kinase [Candidatus Limnocylindrales bacterium]|nr:histidine kinase [Candidatus Limnocylindrales bacterium]
MHPILGQLRRLALYLLAWIPLAALLAYLFAVTGALRAGEAVALAFPLCLIYAFICLSAYYSCRATPFDRTSISKLVATHAAGALLASGIWIAIGKALAYWLSRTTSFSGIDENFSRQIPLLLGTGVLFYLLSIDLYYVLMAVAASKEAEARALQASVLAREAELKALKAQVNPHFLFNSLNSISALTSSDPAKAREMCILLGDFLRRTLGLGEKSAIPLEEELSLVHSFLAVEKVRFGARIQMEENIDKSAMSVPVPPLLLQPLVENAVVHGIANLVEGGTVRLDVKASDGILSVVVENTFDPDAPPRRKSGVGLANVRQRLAARYGREASMDVKAAGDQFRVAIALPVQTETSAS